MIGNDVWISYEAVVLSGVTIRKRFDDAVIERLEALRWWNWDEETIRCNIPAIQSGDIAAVSLR